MARIIGFLAEQELQEDTTGVARDTTGAVRNATGADRNTKGAAD